MHPLPHGEKSIDLKGSLHKDFTVSYNNLKPYAKWYEWGNKTIAPLLTRPGNMPADVSPLTKILTDHEKEGRANLSDGELRTIYLWLDGNAAFYGSFLKSEQLAQREGRIIRRPGCSDSQKFFPLTD